MKIYYGILENKLDVTDICFSKLKKDNIITIPFCDTIRAYYFTDPIYGVHKNVIIDLNNSVTEYNEFTRVQIDTKNNIISILDENQINQKWLDLKSKLNINYGSFNEEIPEQKMVIRYLNGNEKVLEIGGNIGRNSLTIASILQDETNLVVLESGDDIAKRLQENRDINLSLIHI